MENKQKTRKEEILEAISQFPLIQGEKNIMGHVIPRGRSIILKERPDLEQSQLTSSSGIIMAPSQDNSVKARIGVIVAIGPDADSDLKVGQLVYFNQFVNLQVLIMGNLYLKMHDADVYFHINPEGRTTYIGQGKTEEEKRRDEGLAKTIEAVNNFNNELAEMPDKIKHERKTRKIHIGIGKGGDA